MDKKLLKQYKSTFQFGTSVSYGKILKREGNHNDKIWNKEWAENSIEIRIGVVVGWRWLSNGIKDYDSDYGYSYQATQSIFAIEIKRGMMNKVDLVLPESLKINGIFEHNFDGIIHIPDRVDVFPEKDKAWLRDVMKDVKRDAKGRWRK